MIPIPNFLNFSASQNAVHSLYLADVDDAALLAKYANI
jgi:hypothetical protein